MGIERLTPRLVAEDPPHHASAVRGCGYRSKKRPVAARNNCMVPMKQSRVLTPLLSKVVLIKISKRRHSLGAADFLLRSAALPCFLARRGPEVLPQ